jgi:hypothetical protein
MGPKSLKPPEHASQEALQQNDARGVSPSPGDVSVEEFQEMLKNRDKLKFSSFTLAGKTYRRQADGKIRPDDEVSTAAVAPKRERLE